MRPRTAWLTLGLLAACADAPRANAPLAPALSATPPIASAARPPAPPVDAATLAAKHPRCVVAIDLSRVRGTPLADGVRRVLGRASPWVELGGAIDPVLETEWAVYASPSPYKNPQSAFVLRVAATREALDRAVASASSATGGERFDTHAKSLQGVHAIVDGAPHVLLRKGDSLLAIVPEDGADAVARAIADAKVDPHLSGDFARASLRRPYTMFAALPDTVLDATATVKLEAGLVRVEVELLVPIEPEAIVVAHALERELMRPSDLTRVLGDLTQRIAIAPRGTTVHVTLEADPQAIAEALARVP